VARLNLEDKFFVELLSVAVKLGNEDLAIGNAVRFFREAQEKHRQGKAFTEEEFRDRGFSEHLIPTFAKRVPAGIIAAGAEKHFAWLQQKVEAGRNGGRKSASRPRDEKGRLISNLHQAEPKRDPDETKHIQASYSISPSSSSSSSSSLSFGKESNAVQNTVNLFGEETGEAGEGGKGTPVSRIIGEYFDLWKHHHRGKATVLGKDRNLLRLVVKDLGEARTLELLEAYFAMPDAFFKTRKHDVATFHANLAKITAFADTGEFTTRTQANQFDRTASNASLIERIRRGDL
jgi:hypothetical protein